MKYPPRTHIIRQQTLRLLLSIVLLLLAVGSASAQNWQLVWSDEFNGSIGPDWSFETGAGGWGNNEQQYYQRQNATIENNMLAITAKRESVGGANYTSARMKTQGHRAWKYGKIVARIALPGFQGSWPGFWMLGDNIGSVGWPACGEIDIMEQINTEQTVHGSNHWNNNGQADWTSSAGTNIGAFHEYSVTWDNQYIRFAIDDKQYSQFYIGGNSGGTNAFNNNNFFLLLNLAVGGNWPGGSVNNGALPGKMLVDYVRVYQAGSANPHRRHALDHQRAERRGGGQRQQLHPECENDPLGEQRRQRPEVELHAELGHVLEHRQSVQRPSPGQRRVLRQRHAGEPVRCQQRQQQPALVGRPAERRHVQDLEQSQQQVARQRQQERQQPTLDPVGLERRHPTTLEPPVKLSPKGSGQMPLLFLALIRASTPTPKTSSQTPMKTPTPTRSSVLCPSNFQNVKIRPLWRRAAVMTAFAGLYLSLSSRSFAAIDSGSADTNYNSFKNTFLYWSGNTAFFHNAIGSSVAEDGWVAALEILAVEDVYERTQSSNDKKLVNDLCNTFLSRNSPSNWSKNNWNDDIGWYALAMIRGYQITGTQNQLTQAEYGFNLAYNRGWDTQYNGGGVWQVQPSAGPNPHKDPLSNNSLGKVAALIYQSTGDTGYLTKANNLYNWAWHNIYNPNTGEVYLQLFQDGRLVKTPEAYNQGTWADFANIMHDITGNATYLNDAQKTLDFTKSNVTSNGILAPGGGYIVTWADELGRALGHVCRKNPSLWSKYWPWMKQNADAIWDNRRTDNNITWNYWNQKTPTSEVGTSKFISALAWLQYTPVSNPAGGGSSSGGSIAGTHSIINVQNGEAVDNAGSNAQKAGVTLWGSNGGNAQKWTFTQNSDTSWNIVSVFSGQALNDGNSSANGAQMIQYPSNSGDNNQRWWVDRQSDGTYKIWNKANSKSLDSGNKSGNNLPLLQWDYSGGSQQRWNLQ